MKKILTLFTLCCCLAGCVKNGSEKEYPDLTTIVGNWEQTIYSQNQYHLVVNKNTLKLYYYDKADQINYIINGTYVDNKNSVYAKDIATDTYKNFKYNMPHCDLLFFDDMKIGFIRIK